MLTSRQIHHDSLQIVAFRVFRTVTKGNVEIDQIKINSDNFGKVQAEIDRINNGTGSPRSKSDAAWNVLKKYNYK